MAFQWTFIATFLYFEIGIVALLLVPFISPARWSKIFRSRLVSAGASYSHIYFNVFIAILLLLFVDSIREVYKYAEPLDYVDLKHNPDSENRAHMKLFRAQRNFYITGFALFLWFIIKRLITLTSAQAKLEAERSAFEKQAKSATEAAKRMMEEIDNKRNKESEGDDLDENKSLAQKLDKTKEELVKVKEECKRAKMDAETIKSQAESTNREYDRLLKEHEALQAKVEKSGSKKDN